MESVEIFQYIRSLEAKIQAQSMEIKELRDNTIDVSRLKEILLSISDVVRIHDISPNTVRDYTRRGLIEKHWKSTDGKTWFRASDVLQWDFKALRREKKLQTR